MNANCEAHYQTVEVRYDDARVMRDNGDRDILYDSIRDARGDSVLWNFPRVHLEEVRSYRSALEDAFPKNEQSRLESLFQELASDWRLQCASASSVTKMAMHPAYQRIIGLGQPVVPLLLRELERKPENWFWALKAITGADPVPARDRGLMRKMAAAWIEWGRNAGYRW